MNPNALQRSVVMWKQWTRDRTSYLVALKRNCGELQVLRRDEDQTRWQCDFRKEKAKVKGQVPSQTQAVSRSLGRWRRMLDEGGTFESLAREREGLSAGFVPVLWDARWCYVCMRPKRWDPKWRVCVSPLSGSWQRCGEPKGELRHGAAYVKLASGRVRAVVWLGSGRRGF